MAAPSPTRALRIHAPGIGYFDAVRRAGSIREAARRLNVASSAVNRQILNMEAELGAKLFDRLPGRLRLTAAGEILAQHVITVLRDAERARSELDALAGLRTGHVELVTLEGLCHRVVPEAVAALQGRQPRITVSTCILGSGDIPGAILSGDAHLGLAFEVRRHPGLRQLAVARLPLGAVVPPDSPLADRAAITMADCAGPSLILPSANFANRDQIDALLQGAGRAEGMRVGYEAGSVELMKRMVLLGLGIAFMTRAGLEAELEAGRLVHVPLHKGRAPILSELGLYARAETALPAAAAAFAQHMGDALGRLHGPGG
ncbi:LysR family transcriptional regulator [Roseomonas sp. KE2513]|uniref:LysR family transcriptional regulator n=1 Tax=Roseomonas sp. KE2513 TaxID=2479202 RepID=UPI0018DF4856|nr:LysR family transcriptional regulator [Roseomonas sp. KE2513]MBI0534488.1 LysR family transcriptional regulator [Roseomonas sp. KE2513]